MKTIYIVVILISAISLVNCTKPETTDIPGEQNKAIYDKYLQSFLNGDSKTLESLLDDNFRGYGPAMKDSLNKQQFVESSKKEEVKKYTYKSIVRLPIHLDSGTAVGDWVSEWGEITIPSADGLLSAKIRIHEVCRIKDGKINLSIGYYNTADVLEQFGFKFIPSGEQ